MSARAHSEQIRAAEPRTSSWVAANAGSGKTRVLTDRVARLLLAGSEPARILCLTYTRAAAAEMQTRLFDRLGAWSMLDDPPLAEALTGLGVPQEALAPPNLARARTLFARALETPGGLKIQTIHAFCDALLRRFPLEAGVAPGFAILDERQARALRADALGAVAEADPLLLETLGRHLAGDDPEPLLAEIVAKRACFAGPLDEAGLARSLAPATSRAHAPASDAAFPSAEAIAASVLCPATRALIEAILPAFAAGSPADARCAPKLAQALSLAGTDRSSAAAADLAGSGSDSGAAAAALALLEEVFLTGKGAKEPFAPKLGKCPTKATRAAIGPRAAEIDALMLRLAEARPRRLAAQAIAKSLALHRFARAFLAAYDGLKAVGLLDFDDLIARSVALLSDPALAAFVLWRLDGGLDHVLVDEAQDTSPPQWRVIEAITDELFTGESARTPRVGVPCSKRFARGLERTVFVVGDEKQSIYSFQGADPSAFKQMRTHFERRLQGMEDELQACALLQSFRSARPILTLVDELFAGPAGRHFEAPVRHEPADPRRAGRVELWPFLPKPEKPEEPAWDRPLDLAMPDDPVLALADRLARAIRTWLDAGRPIPSPEGPRPIRAGDILILVQRRGTVFHPLIRALKRHAVPVAGADVLRVGGELAVKDLQAALRVAATPADDLSLACLLRSPLCGLGEAELFRLAHGRRGALISALSASAHAGPAALIQDLRDHADFLRPYELIERILVQHEGRRRLVARLGPEAEDGIDALLDLALEYETAEPPTLSGFLAWISRGETVVKRRLDDSADEVRVMTVHGAKGLQAPVVILPDTACREEAGPPPQVVPLGASAAWRVAAEESPPPLQAAEAERRARLAAENRRLLYVALTRAESWLVVCGAGKAGEADDACWHASVAAALDRLGARCDAEGGRMLAQDWPERLADDEVCVAEALAAESGRASTGDPEGLGDDEGRVTAGLAAGSGRAPVQDRPGRQRWPDRRPVDGAPGAAALPAWTRQPPPPLAPAPSVLSPSDLGGAHALPGEPAEADPLARGRRLHLLLEALPVVPRPERAALAARLLPGAADLGDLLAEAEAVLAAPALAPLFGPGSRAEVAIAAPFGPPPGQILGRIDRLLVEPHRVLAADFKSNLVLPPTQGQVPEAILRQMGAYAACLRLLYADRRVETAIVWTRGPILMPLDPALTAAALARAGLSGASPAEPR